MLVYTWIQELFPVSVQAALTVLSPSLVRVFTMSVLLCPMMWVHLNLNWICLTVSGSCACTYVADQSLCYMICKAILLYRYSLTLAHAREGYCSRSVCVCVCVCLSVCLSVNRFSRKPWLL